MKSVHLRRSKRASRAARKLYGLPRGVVAKAPGVRKALEPSARADLDRLMNQLREANEKLIVAAVRAQDASDVAHIQVVQARTELDNLMRQLEDANERLAAAA